jgi:hypothetical protein
MSEYKESGSVILVGLAILVTMGLVMTITFGYIILSYGIVVSKTWSWFLVPLGLPDIGFWHAAGLSILISLLTVRGYVNVDRDHKAQYFWATLLQPWLAFGLMAIIRVFMG